MKGIQQYIIERQKSFTLTRDERDRLIELIGYATDQSGEDADVKKYEKFRNDLYETELCDMIDLYDTLNDDRTYPKITNKILLPNDIYYIKKLINFALDNDLDDLSDILDKIQ